MIVNCCPQCGHVYPDMRSVNGGKKGGKSRMARLNKDQRSALGKLAAAKRWSVKAA